MKRVGVLLLTVMLLLVLAPTSAFAAESDTFDQDMTNYLTEVSTIRGFEVTKEDIDLTLAQYGMKTQDFTTVLEMKTYLGNVILADLSNLSGVYSYYGLDETTLTELLGEYGEEINDYIFVDDLDSAVAFYKYDSTDYTDGTADLNLEEIMSILGQLGITEDELSKLMAYYETMGDYLSGSEVQSKLESLSARMMTLGGTIIEKAEEDENYKPTEAEINELVSIYDELLSILKLKVEFYLSKDGSFTPISFTELLQLDDIAEADLKIELYTQEGELLADIIVEGGSDSGLGEIIDEVNNAGTGNPTTQTVKGGTLPKTASDYLLNALIGLFLTGAGVIVYRKLRTTELRTAK